MTHCRLTASLALLLSASAMGQEGHQPDPLFQDQSILEAQITGPLTTLVRERPREEYLEGVFEYVDSDGETVALDLEIRARGNYRHQICDYPPVLLNLKRKQVKETLFEHQNKLKMVIQCNRSDQFEQAVLREYLAYRILNALTDKSFRVRLLAVTYVNNENYRENEPRYAFLIEHKNRLAERFELQDLAVEKVFTNQLDGAQLNLTSVFEYLIGNTDFSPIAGPPGDKCCHNYVLFGQGENPEWAVPYDFDQSGFVDAPYAEPNPNLRIRTVRQRLYRGRCINNEHLPASLQAFRDKKDEIYALVEEQPDLKPYVRKDLIRYIDDFYKLIDKPRDVERRMVRACI